jgi:hypothetical protein
VVSGALANCLDQDGALLVVLAVPLVEGLEHLAVIGQ